MQDNHTVVIFTSLFGTINSPKKMVEFTNIKQIQDKFNFNLGYIGEYEKFILAMYNNDNFITSSDYYLYCDSIKCNLIGNIKPRNVCTFTL